MQVLLALAGRGFERCSAPDDGDARGRAAAQQGSGKQEAPVGRGARSLCALQD
jgi:hypothetical protein